MADDKVISPEELFGANVFNKTVMRARLSKSAFKEPKNHSSTRNITLPSYCCDLLAAHRSEQLQDRLKLGTLWHDNDFIFTTWDGQEMNPDTPSKWFPAFLKRK
jgi:dephospho-CoA kinase